MYINSFVPEFIIGNPFKCPKGYDISSVFKYGEMFSYALFAIELFLKLPLSNISSFNSKLDSIIF